MLRQTLIRCLSARKYSKRHRDYVRYVLIVVVVVVIVVAVVVLVVFIIIVVVVTSIAKGGPISDR